MSRKAIAITSFCMLFTLMSTAFLRKAGSEQERWQIGLLLCLSGPCASDGTDAMRGARMAADEINRRGGVLGRMIEFVIQDTNEAVSGAQAVTGYRALRLNKRLNYIIGPSWTPAGLALAPLAAAERDVIMASPSLGAPQFHQAGENIFNLRGTDEIASRNEARYVFNHGARRAAILSSQQPWEAQQAFFFEDEFKRLGGEITVKEEPLPTVTDVKAETLRIVRSRPDAVFLASVILMGQAAQELREMRYRGLQVASTIDSTRIAESAGALDNTVFFSFQKPNGNFQEKFMQLYGEEAQPAGAVGYDTVYAFANAVERAGTFVPAQARREMLDLDFEGASGRIRFDSEGCALREPLGWRVAGQSYGPLEHLSASASVLAQR